jgi:hypothetical protein
LLVLSLRRQNRERQPPSQTRSPAVETRHPPSAHRDRRQQLQLYTIAAEPQFPNRVECQKI